MALDAELLDLPDPADFPEDLENLDDQDWVSLFLENSSPLDDCDSASLGEFLPEFLEGPPFPKEATGSPSSAITQHSNSSSREEIIKDEEAGSDSNKPSSSGESNSSRPIKRLGKRKVEYAQEEKQEDGDGGDDEEVKRKARLMRNRESAQLSRQRKKAYVDDLEERVRTLNATVAELNNTVSLISAENVNLRNQLAYYYHSRNGGGKPGAYAPPPPMGMPVYQYPGGYVLRPGSSAPPVPIPRLKTQASAVKSVKRAKVSKDENSTKKPSSTSSTASGKTKKLASVAALGLLCVMALVFPLDLGIPVTQRTGQIRAYVSSDPAQARIGGRVLMGLEDERNESSKLAWSPGDGYKLESKCERQDKSGAVIDGSMFPANVSTYGNATQRFPASLLFPRDNQVVKVDGDLVIQAVMAGDKAASVFVASSRDSSASTSPTSTAAQRSGASHAPALLNSGVFQDIAFRALPPSDVDTDDPQRKILNDLAGTPFSTGACNEVFQFEISPEPRPPQESPTTSAKRSGSYRRNLSAVPLPPGPSSSSPGGGKQFNSSSTGGGGNFSEKSQRPSSMVVSIFNPKQVPSTGSKDLARIFVVVLVDSVKYVTYSCMLPPQPRLVTG
ncbi:bZIP transcription factor 60-like [Selaginella moellendorffii]|nr:bZIP transcription factor 60-like [Selaginella moellendorffii]|eukprot:XP_024522084.1 bZIP transcription factor 60-like [Selaginella moellendorffii]